jgi:sporulation protein YlmC with PRC-barrel domain
MKKYLSVFFVLTLALGIAVGSSSIAIGKETKSTDADHRANKIIGMNVKDQQGKKFGEIRDLLMDPQQPGRVLFVVIDPGRSMEFGGDRLMAIPFNALVRNAWDDFFVVNMTRDRLRKAPSFDEDHWPNLADRSWNDMVYRYYGLAYYWTEKR